MASDALSGIRNRRGGAAQATGPAPVTAAATTPSKARGRAQSAAQGLSLGFADEATAGLVAALSRFSDSEGRSFTEVFKDELGLEREEMARNRKELGLGETLAVEAGGGLLTGGIIGALAKRVLPRLGLSAVNATRASVVAANPSAQGAVEGGIAGFGASEGDLVTRGIDAAQGAAIGAGSAGLITYGGRAVGAAFPEDAARSVMAAGKRLIDRADELLIRLSPAARTGNAAGAISESALQRSGLTRSLFNADIDHNKAQVGRLIRRRFGLKAGTQVDGEATETIRKSIEKQYDEIGENMADAISLAPVDVQQQQHMMSIFTEVEDAVGDVVKPDRLEKALNMVSNAMDGTKDKQVVMDTINHLRKRGAAAYRSGEIVDGEALSQLEDLMTLAAMDADPRLADKLMKARQAWRDFKIIDNPTVTRAATGEVNPVAMTNLLNRSRFTRKAFGAAAELDNEVLEIGRLVQQVEATTNNPGLMFGIGRSSFTPEGQSLGLGQMAGTALAGGLFATGRALGPQNTTRIASAARQITPRLAALRVGEREGDQ